jgi:hypothetical protein
MAGEDADEQDPAAEPLLSKEFDYDKHAQAVVAHSKLRSTSVAMILCLLMFFSILTMRLELERDISWPIYVDSIPLWILPCLLYLTAADFAATRIGVDAALGKIVVVSSGFVMAVTLLLITLFVLMKLTFVVHWPWTVVLAPSWAVVLMAQFFVCFLIPGFLQSSGGLKSLLVLFVGIWLAALTLLLVGLKLDGELPSWDWIVICIPVFILLVGQIVGLPFSMVDTIARVVTLICSLLLALQLDGTIKIPWVIIFGPFIFLLVVNLVMLCMGIGEDDGDSPV